MSSSLDQLIEKVRSEAQTSNEAGRKEILGKLQRLGWSIESPYEEIYRIMFGAVQIQMVQIGIDLNLYQMLVEKAGPISTQAICKSTGAAFDTISRVCRSLASSGIIGEHADNEWIANKTTRNLCDPGWAGAVQHYSLCVGLGFARLPEYLKARKYQEVSDGLDTALGESMGFTGTNPFIYMQSRPDLMKNFIMYMTEQRASQPNGFDVYPIKQKALDLSPDQVFFVDIGGSAGHQCIEIRKHLPDLPNKVILQDLPPVLEMRIPHPGVESMVQDFWQPQAVTGARIYYMRNIIHDYPDQTATIILNHTRAALGNDPKAVLLIDEMVLPNTGAHVYQTDIDITMMSALAARERTEDQWHKLITNSGFVVQKIWKYTESLGDSIIECVPAQKLD